MNAPEVSEPILCSPYVEPTEYWHIVRGESPERKPGRRPAGYFFRDPNARSNAQAGGVRVELPLVNRLRAAVASWRTGNRGWTRTTEELWRYWTREGRQHRLFYAQLEAVETIIFLVEGRRDLVAPIDSDIPLDRLPEDGPAFRRYACKLATGSGKTTVMGMLAAWSILNKVHDKSRTEFADTVLAVCPNVTIRGRLAELDPAAGDASLYRTRDLVPSHLMADLSKGRVLVTNWHALELQSPNARGTAARVDRRGKPMETRETITIGKKTTTARGTRYMTPEAFAAWQITAGVEVLEDTADKHGTRKVTVKYTRYVESDTAFVRRVLKDSRSGRGSILVLNDEAHHAYRIRKTPDDDQCPSLIPDDADDDFDDEEEATVWVEGLDRLHGTRGIRWCVDLSATPYYLSRAGADANKPFGWVVSDFGLEDAIESGLVKIPQLPVRDTSGDDKPKYFNIWDYVLGEMTSRERGGKNSPPKPEAVLRHAHTPLAILAGDWAEETKRWEEEYLDDRRPVFIVVCKNTALAKVVYEWLAKDDGPDGIPKMKVRGFRNTDKAENTIRVDSRVVAETDSGQAKTDESRWMRLTLDTVGRGRWPTDPQGRPVYPEGFVELAEKLGRPLHPPGRDVRCVVSVGMLTEGWDCNTVTHIVGLRPFMSQLLCEQVVGRALRRRTYVLNEETGRLEAEVAKVLGVPFELIPVKSSAGKGNPLPPRHHVKPLEDKAAYRIEFPRVDGYTRAIRNEVKVDWNTIAPLPLDITRIPPEVEMKATVPDNNGRPSLTGPGALKNVTLNPYRQIARLQELAFELARDLTRKWAGRPDCDVPAHRLFPQMLAIATRYLDDKVLPMPPAEKRDVFLSPYYGWVVERLEEAIQPADRESPELPLYETGRKPGSTGDVDFWTARDVREVVKSHLNYVVADTAKWEQSAAAFLDRDPNVGAFVKNSGLGFGIGYNLNREEHEYIPDFIVRLAVEPAAYLILEVKGFADATVDVKRAAAERWVNAVNADGTYGQWAYDLVGRPDKVPETVGKWVKHFAKSNRPAGK